MRMRLPQRPGFYFAHLEVASACPGRRCCCPAGFVFSRDSQRPGPSPWPVLRKGGPHGGNRSSERGRCRRLQVQVDQAVEGGLHLGGVILSSLGARG